MKLPRGRGPVSEELVEALRLPPHDLRSGLPDRFAAGYVLDDEDLQLTLHVCYELHYQGWDGVDDRWEWNPSLLALRAVAEERFEDCLRRLVPVPGDVRPDAVPAALTRMTGA